MADGPDRARGGVRSSRFAAFISYSHADEEVGDWLHKRLEAYEVPASLVGREGPAGPIRKRLGKVFRDRVDLSAAHDLGAEIRAGLEQADALIVLCSPRSCGSRYVNEEIRYFKTLGRGRHILAVIVDGEPHAAGKTDFSADDECFPPALVCQLGPGGVVTSTPEPNEPIAADIRGGKDGLENGALKLIAGLLGVGLDELVQRERQAERRRRVQAYALAAGMAALALTALVGGGFAWWLRGVAAQNEQRALQGEDAAREAQGVASAERDRALSAQRAEAAQRMIAEQQRAAADIERNRANISSARARLETARQVANQGDLVTAGLVAHNVLESGSAVPASLEDHLARALLYESNALARERQVMPFQATREFEGYRGPEQRAVVVSIDATGRYLIYGYFATEEMLIADARSGATVRTMNLAPDIIRSLDLETNTLIIGVSGTKCLRMADFTISDCPGRSLEAFGDRNPYASYADGNIVVTRRDGSAVSLEAPPGQLVTLRISERREAAFARTNQGIYSWRLSDGRLIVARSRVDWDAGLLAATPQVAFDDTNRRLALTREDGGIDIIGYDSGAVLMSLVGHTSFVDALAFDGERNELVSVARDNSLRRWDLRSELMRRVLVNTQPNIAAAALNSFHRHYILVDRAGALAAYNVDTGEPAWRLDLGTGVSALASQMDFLVVGFSNGRVRYGASYDEGVLSELPRHREAVNAIALSSRGEMVATGGADDVAIISRSGSGELVCRLRHESSVTALSFESPRHLLTGTSSGHVRRWDLRNCVQLQDRQISATARITSVSGSPAGTWIAGTNIGDVVFEGGQRETPRRARVAGHVLQIRPLGFGLAAIVTDAGAIHIVSISQHVAVGRVTYSDRPTPFAELSSNGDIISAWGSGQLFVANALNGPHSVIRIRCLTDEQRARFGLALVDHCLAAWP